MKTNNNIRRMVMTALFMALVCTATMVIRIPTPGTNGYIHPGDALVILSGIFLGPVQGLLAAGIGSALADFLGGYLLYVPATFLIKGLTAFCCGLVFQRLSATAGKRTAGVVIGGLTDMVFVACGYWLYETCYYGMAAALASVPSNLIQGLGGLVLAVILYPVLAVCRRQMEQEEKRLE